MEEDLVADGCHVNSGYLFRDVEEGASGSVGVREGVKLGRVWLGFRLVPLSCQRSAVIMSWSLRFFLASTEADTRGKKKSKEKRKKRR